MTPRRRQMRTAKELDRCSGRLPGDAEDDMLGKIDGRKRGTTRGSPRRSRTAKASHISRFATKLGCAREWGGSGRLSDDGLGQHNLARSEDPWSRATQVARMAVLKPAGGPDLERGIHAAAESTKDGGKPGHATGMLGASLTAA